MEKRVPQGKLGRRRSAGGAMATAGVLAARHTEPRAPRQELRGPRVDRASRPPGRGRLYARHLRRPALEEAGLPRLLPGAGYAAHAVSEVLFWTDQMMEHAFFIALLMPGDHLRGPRDECAAVPEPLRQAPSRRATGADGGLRISSLLASMRPSVQRSIEYKRRTQRAQESGPLRASSGRLLRPHRAGGRAPRCPGSIGLAYGNTALESDEVAGVLDERSWRSTSSSSRTCSTCRSARSSTRRTARAGQLLPGRTSSGSRASSRRWPTRSGARDARAARQGERPSSVARAAVKAAARGLPGGPAGRARGAEAVSEGCLDQAVVREAVCSGGVGPAGDVRRPRSGVGACVRPGGGAGGGGGAAGVPGAWARGGVAGAPRGVSGASGASRRLGQT